MRAAPDDRMLSDDEWAAIAHEVMHHTELSPYGQEDEAVRWIAVRHGDDHIHLVAMLARQDGGKPNLSWERYKVRALWGLTWQYQSACYRLLRSAAWLLILSGCRPSPRCLVPRRNRVGRAWPGQPLPADGTAGPRSPPT